MKNVIKLFFAGITALAFAHCGSSQVLESNPPFRLDTCHLEPWTAGAGQQYSGVNLFFPVVSGKEVVLDSVYYGTRRVPLQRIQRDSYLVFKAVIDTTKASYDIIAHADPREEFGNKPPRVEKIPFDLKENEAVVSYVEDGNRKYFKVTPLVIAPALRLEERPNLKN